MPKYAYLKDTPLDIRAFSTHLVANSRVGVPYSDDMIASADATSRRRPTPMRTHTALLARYPKAKVGDFDGDPKQLTEMDALVAYLQMLGTLVDFSTYDEAAGYR